MKHGWNTLENYLDAHDSVLKKFSTSFKNIPQYQVNQFTENYLELNVLIKLNHKNLMIKIEKSVEVQHIGRRKTARTDSYSYNVYDQIGNYFRYDSPHPHRPFHHKHIYDKVTRKQVVGSPIKIGEDEYPHVSEILSEALSL